MTDLETQAALRKLAAEYVEQAVEIETRASRPGQRKHQSVFN
jgi:hypothetical protein